VAAPAPDVSLHRHVALLRAVNVGKRQVRMASLRQWLEEAGYAGVETYIQTGNVKVETPVASAAAVGTALEELLRERAGFAVPCIMATPGELRRVADDADAVAPPPFAGHAEERRFVVFLKEPVSAEDAEAMAAYDPANERIVAVGRAVHLWIAGSFREATVFGRFAKALEPGTNRNLKVVRTLAERWGTSPPSP
jgi:uncharacterized protein (DUF1697 family)